MDPISGVLLGVFDCVGEIVHGLVAGPAEVGRQVTPMLRTYNSGQQSDNNEITCPVTSSGARKGARAAAQVALCTGKGLGRIVTGSLKGPMLVMHGATRGFHNLPRLYGDEVRQFENVTGLKVGC
jgi:hypothetical protein